MFMNKELIIVSPMNITSSNINKY
jgi:hypothetical protein